MIYIKKTGQITKLIYTIIVGILAITWLLLWQGASKTNFGVSNIFSGTTKAYADIPQGDGGDGGDGGACSSCADGGGDSSVNCGGGDAGCGNCENCGNCGGCGNSGSNSCVSCGLF